MATKLYQGTGTITIKVEADSIEEARREGRKLVRELNELLPVGMSATFSEHHQSRELHMWRI